MLKGLRVLDLTDERGLMGGRILADFGADVVQVENRNDARARNRAPLTAEGTSSLVWHAFAAGKRSIELDLDAATDHSTLMKLVQRADVLITSWPRRRLEELGLSPEALRDSYPHLILTTITAFGWSGPKADYPASDLTVWAAGGPLAPHRDGEMPPVGISVPQAFLHASADAATGTLLAVIERNRSGRGQHVDVSAQVSVSQATLSRVLADAVGDENPEWQQTPGARTDRSGSGAATPNAFKKWDVRDGLVELHLSMGAAAGAFTNRLFEWIGDERELPADIAGWDWRSVPERMVSNEITAEDLDRARQSVREFLATKTKAEVLDAAMSRRLLCMPILDMSEVAASEHLNARGFFADIEIDGKTARIPATPAQVEGAPQPHVRGSAPGLGAHTAEVLEEWSQSHISHEEVVSGLERELPLEGLRVLDLSWVVAGPLIGRTLADFGADVLRVESSKRIDTARMMQPFHNGKPDPEGSVLYGNTNAGKRGMTLDLTTDEGQQIVRELADKADVVIESFAPGQLAKWGLEPQKLRESNPRLIVLSTSIAGQSGPWSKLAGFGNVGSSLSGFQLLVGWPDRLPFGPFGPYTDYVGPRFSLVALLAALQHRGNNGSGCTIDVSQLESGVYFLSPQIVHSTRDGVIAQRLGNASPDMAPHGVFEASDERFVALAVADDDGWNALCSLMQREDLRERQDLRTVEGRLQAQTEIQEIVSQWAASLPAERLEALLLREGIAAHIAQTPADYIRDPQLAYRGHLVELEHPIHGTTTVEGARVLLTETPGGPATPAPTFGQHSEEVLRDELNYETDTIADLRHKGVLA